MVTVQGNHGNYYCKYDYFFQISKRLSRPDR